MVVSMNNLDLTLNGMFGVSFGVGRSQVHFIRGLANHPFARLGHRDERLLTAVILKKLSKKLAFIFKFNYSSPPIRLKPVLKI